MAPFIAGVLTTGSSISTEPVHRPTPSGPTPEEHRHIEAALRNKIERLEIELRDARAAKAKADRTAERERGKAEHWHMAYTAVLTRVSSQQPSQPAAAPDDEPVAP